MKVAILKEGRGEVLRGRGKKPSELFGGGTKNRRIAGLVVEKATFSSQGRPEGELWGGKGRFLDFCLAKKKKEIKVAKICGTEGTT